MIEEQQIEIFSVINSDQIRFYNFPYDFDVNNNFFIDLCNEVASCGEILNDSAVNLFMYILEKLPEPDRTQIACKMFSMTVKKGLEIIKEQKIINQN